MKISLLTCFQKTIYLKYFAFLTASYILSVLDTLDFTHHNKLKILFGLIKGYVQDEKYDIAIPLLKTTLEDLLSDHSPQEEIVFKMMEIMVIVYK